MSKVREMVSSDTVIGQPITTPDGVTLVPVSRLSFGFTCGGSDFGKQVDGKNFAGGTASAVKVDPVAFLVVKDGVTRVMPVAIPAMEQRTASSKWCPRSWTGWRASWIKRRKLPNSNCVYCYHQL